MIEEKEFKVIDEVRRGSVITQREISQRTGFSLGLTNVLLKNLIKKGYIKITKPDRRSLQYFLTPRGMAEVANRTYQYFFRTIHSLGEIKVKIQSLLLKEYSQGRRKFIILGDGELAEITEIALCNLDKKDVTYTKQPHYISPINGNGKDFLFLITKPEQKIKNENSSLDILKEIANFP